MGLFGFFGLFVLLGYLASLVCGCDLIVCCFGFVWFLLRWWIDGVLLVVVYYVVVTIFALLLCIYSFRGFTFVGGWCYVVILLVCDNFYWVLVGLFCGLRGLFVVLIVWC